MHTFLVPILLKKMTNFKSLGNWAVVLSLICQAICQDIASTPTTINPTSPRGRTTTNGGVFTFMTENPSYGTMADKLQNLLGSVYPFYRYSLDLDFRPGMTSPSDGEPEPTEVEIYMRSLRILENGPSAISGVSWPTIKIETDFVVEYINPQKAYDSNLLPDLPYLRLPQQVANWDPELYFFNVSCISTSSSPINMYNNNYRYNQELLLNSEGRLLRKVPISIVLSNPLLNSSGLTDNVFKLQIMSNTYTTNEVKLLWKKTNPVLFADNKFLNVEGLEWFQAHVLTSVCKGRNEEYGSFGVRKFSCLELQIKVTRASDVPPTVAGKSRAAGGAGPVWTANFGTEN